LISPNEITEQGDPIEGQGRFNSTHIRPLHGKLIKFPEHEEWAKSQLQQYFTSSHGEELKYTNPISSANYIS
jgi:hypothetical protein